MPRISILLPTWNGERDLERLLPALAAQSLAGEAELLATDSSSMDRSVELLRAAGAEVEVIPQAEFSHGGTRNALAARARGELLVFLSQDAVPEDASFLEELTRPFELPEIAGVYARVLPHDGDDPLTARTVLHAPEASDVPRESALAGSASADLSAERRAEILNFNNVASAVRAAVFREHPFPEVAFGEDCGWAARVLDEGWRIRFEPRAVVRHAHAYSPREAYARYRVDAAFQLATLGRRVRPGLVSTVRGFGYEVLEDLRFLARHHGPGGLLRHLPRSILLRGAQVLGQLHGSHGDPREDLTARSDL